MTDPGLLILASLADGDKHGHSMPLYGCPELNQSISPALRKRMQGKTCFNFKGDLDPEPVAELKRLAENGFKQWTKRNWI